MRIDLLLRNEQKKSDVKITRRNRERFVLIIKADIRMSGSYSLKVYLILSEEDNLKVYF